MKRHSKRFVRLYLNLKLFKLKIKYISSRTAGAEKPRAFGILRAFNE
ncbi:hypothetical protein GQ261_08605 [Campylobacter upsaliensis]|nr:hypothetical protein [Campylobacter upsaliensis]EKH7233402.1 hypothetical protein [Campylobacter upsaliensis]ELM7648534.1 hypothetical protein [Campylobacter upsaliensis]ELU9597772.1 hypothetical protein [Campylobacter upsaliensis]